MPFIGGSRTQQTVSNNQTSIDGSANAAGAQSLTASQRGRLDVDQRSDYVEYNYAKSKDLTVGGSGITVGSEGVLNIATDHGAIDVAREISLAALEGSAAYNRDLRHFVESNHNLARSIAEGAFAIAADAPPPDTTRRALWIGGGLVALALLLSTVAGVFGRKKKAKQ